ncbi:MAG: metallophosphoesterase [Oscillospiraceae bacterium]|jgi:hypothetical protein|nr:metallophosphoesterase [Oscillospiraceae bacterium]
MQLPAIRFAVCSDIHYYDNPLHGERWDMKRAFRQMTAWGRGGGYPGLDALAVAGDFTNSGSEKQFRDFARHLDRRLPPETRKLVILGNHEFPEFKEQPPAYDRLARYFGHGGNIHEVVKGFHFIGISEKKMEGRMYDDMTHMFLSDALAQAAADAPGRPIIVFHHAPLQGTVARSHHGIAELKEILRPYPQIVDFSGHKHHPLQDESTIWRGTAESEAGAFLCIGTSSVAFPETPKDHPAYCYVTQPPWAQSQMVFCEISADGDVSVILWDIKNGTPYRTHRERGFSAYTII